MSETIKARTARKPHLCENCQWTPSLRKVPTIAPGHRYLLHTAFPGHDVLALDKPMSVKECVACANARDPFAALLKVGACARFCCGDVPCAMPDRHDGEHQCRRCAGQLVGAL